MNHTKKILFAAVALFLFPLSVNAEEQQSSIAKSTGDVVKTTVRHTQGALCAALQGVDHLFYPGLCLLTGRTLYHQGIGKMLSHPPVAVENIEKNIPGGDLARHTLTYAALGAFVCISLKYVSDIQEVRDFLKKNMPHLAGLLQHIKTEYSPEQQVAAKIKRRKITQN